MTAIATTVRAALLDDDPVERERLAELLRGDELRIETLGPTSISGTIGQIGDLLGGPSGPRVVMLDYRLDDADEASNFRGGSIAAALRDSDNTRDVPLVLFTTEAKLKTWVESRPGTQDLFDWRVLKGEITEERLAIIRERLADLASAGSRRGARTNRRARGA
jgi:CheY-like chemotaxis protein